MASTTNYGWTTPDDTGLVKDGASAIRSLGTAIDTTVKSNADAAINKTLIDAKGDLIVGSAADTAARVAVGTDGQVLTADSTQSTGVKWATAATGGMTLISTTTISNNASITLSSIPSAYKDLRVIIRGYKPSVDGEQLYFRFNGDSTASRTWSSSAFGTSSSTTQAFNNNSSTITYPSDNAATDSIIYMDFIDYANTSTWKSCDVVSYCPDLTTTTSFNRYYSRNLYNQTSAISSLYFYCGSGNLLAGTILLYGVA